MGVMMFGPTLLEYGSDEQKKKHVPGNRSKAKLVVPGYSEPGAGSDLARCARNASTKATHSCQRPENWTSVPSTRLVFCLVRTDNTKKHEGISSCSST